MNKEYVFFLDPLRLLELKAPVATWTVHPGAAKALYNMQKPMRKKLRRLK